MNNASNWKIYGNVFLDSASHGNGLIGVGNSKYTAKNIQVFNNTVINSECEFGFIYATTGWEVKNNILFDCKNGPVFGSGVSHSYNATNGSLSETGVQTGLTSDIFVNYSGDKLKLTKPTADSLKLNSLYNQDMDGNIRGEDGIWDRGAYEYTGVVDDAFPSVEITSPTTATSYSTTNTTISLAGTASDDGGIVSVEWNCETCTPSNGDAVGTTAWSISDISLSDGSNNIQVVVTDTASQVKTDTIYVTIGNNDTSDGSLPMDGTDDTTAPVLSNLSPTGEIALANPIKLSVTTDEAATCRADLSKAVYEDMLMNLAVSANNSHSVDIAELEGDKTYTYYVRCKDSAGNTSNTAAISFTTNSTITNIQPPANVIISSSN
jgi:hypothetical protein